MSELSGLELRKAACEALGWTNFDASDKGWPPGFTGPNLKCMPAIESDPAASEPMFLEWCAKNGYWWELRNIRNVLIGCDVHWINDGDLPESVHVNGATPSEARARAIVAAQKAKA